MVTAVRVTGVAFELVVRELALTVGDVELWKYEVREIINSWRVRRLE